MISNTEIAPFSSRVTTVYRSTGHTGGTVPASQSLNTPRSITLRPQGNLTRTGHNTFGGWRSVTDHRVFPAGFVMTWPP